MKIPPTSDRARLAVILAIALAARVVFLGRADLWTDEIQTLHAVQLGWTDVIVERLRAGHVPLYFLIEKAWCSAFGTSQLALRMPSAIFGTALLVPAWSLFRRLAGERAAWWGTVLVAFHPLFVELSREARMYSLLGLAALVVADRVAASLDGERPGASFWIAAALGPFIHPTWGVAMLPLAAWFAMERRAASPEARRSSRAALAGVVASVALLAAALAFAHPQHQELTRRPWPREVGVFVLRIFAGSDLGAFRAPAFTAVFVGAWSGALVLGWISASPRERRFAAWIGAGVPLVSVAAGVLGGVPWGPARYVALSAVACVLVVARAARADRLPVAAASIAILLGFLTGAALRRPRTAWSDAAATLRDDPTAVVVDDESSRIVLAHYLGRDVFVGAPPAGTAAWRHAALDVADGRRIVRIDACLPPR